MNARFLPVLALAVMAFVAPLAAQQRWFELYDEAIKHVQQEQWQLAETKLLEARKLNPRSGRNVLRYGSWRDDYYPEYYLGVVYLRTGRPQLAAEQFAVARKANVNAQDAEFRQIAAFETDAREQAARVARGPDPADGTRASSGTTIPPPPIVAPEGPNYSQQIADLLQTARTQLQQRDYDRAQQSVAAARDIAVKQNLASERSNADSLLREIGGGRLAARVEDALKRRDAAGARRELTGLTAAYPTFSAANLTGLVERLERDVRSAELHRGAMRAFFGGNYVQALSQIADAEKLGGLTPRGHFYRACSLAAQAAATENPSRDRRLSEARKSYGMAARDAQQFQQDLRYISPKIRELLGVS